MSLYLILGLNFWFFFVKANALKDCIKNLVPKKVHIEDANYHREVISLLVFGNLCGVAFSPGAHQQFQHWYVYTLPLAFHITEVPDLVIPVIHLALVPCDLARRYIHHIALLALTCYVLFVQR